MFLKELINKSVYGTTGYISSQDDIDKLESYILYNLPVLKEYKRVIVATNYKNYPELTEENTQLWKKYFPDCIMLDSKTNRGHSFGTADLDNSVFDYCKENNIEWICKSDNDMIVQESILKNEIEEADFYYMCGFGYGGFFPPFNYTEETAIEAINNKDFFAPQTSFYFMNVPKIDYLNDKGYIDETYNQVQEIKEYSGKVWEYIDGWSCEYFLKNCVKRNNLSKYHLIPQEKYRILLKLIKDNNIHDSSHKNIMIGGICHYQYLNQQIIEI